MNRLSIKLPVLSHVELRKKVTEGLVRNVQNKMSRKRGRQSSTDAEGLRMVNCTNSGARWEGDKGLSSLL
jgi:hypothetical protein